MIIDARQLPNNEIVESDVCIVGAGAAGITLAREFTGAHFRVCVLESGGFDYDDETQSLYEGTNVGASYIPLDISRLRFFGGSTNHWAGSCRPLDAIDFEARPWVPHSGWPIKRTDIEPYYEKAQSIIQMEPFHYDTLEYWLQKASSKPLKLGGDSIVTRIYQFGPIDPALSFGEAYRLELDRAKNIVVYLHANILEIETNSIETEVTRLRVACLHGPNFYVLAKIYILAMGGIENARVLLLSNKSQPAGLGNTYDLVGRFFMEHMQVESGSIVRSPSFDLESVLPFYYPRMRDDPDWREGRFFGVLAPSESCLRREQIPNVAFALTPLNASVGVDSLKRLGEWVSGGDAPGDFGQHLLNVLGDLDAVADAAYKTVFRTREGVFDPTPSMIKVMVETINEPIPNPDSRVLLSNQRDLFGQNQVKLDWQIDPNDKGHVWRAMEILGTAIGRANYGRLYIALDKDEGRWTEYLDYGKHHMGTTRMSKDPKRGVVNEDCRVHGISNFYIAGSSVFPTAGYAPPTLTIVALAVRLADRIKAEME